MQLDDRWRSLERFGREDLLRLAQIAARDRQIFFQRNQDTRRLYSARFLCSALCQGAAVHYIDGRNGVKDFDVWTFFSPHPDRPFPYRRRGEMDFGDSRFGTSPDRPDFRGKKVDLIGRSIPAHPGEDPAIAIRRWLNGGSKSARELVRKAVVLLDPTERVGEIIWPIQST